MNKLNVVFCRQASQNAKIDEMIIYYFKLYYTYYMNQQFISLAFMQPIECGDIWEGGNQVIKIPAGSQGCSVGVGDYERGQ